MIAYHSVLYDLNELYICTDSVFNEEPIYSTYLLYTIYLIFGKLQMFLKCFIVNLRKN